jgi:F-type H+-transporting ATPase subunit delta
MSDSAGAVTTEVHQVVTGQAVEIARRYALALIDAAAPTGDADSVLQELEEIQRDVLQAFPRFAQVLASSQVSTAHKDQILVELFEKRASSLVLRFLRVLNRHERPGLLDLVIREARSIWEKRNKRIPVQVRSAVPMGETQLKTLRDRLAGLTGATPILQVSIDPDLIAGLVIQVGDQRYDLSVKSRLAQLRQRLIEGKTHEIQSRRDQFSHPA